MTFRTKRPSTKQLVDFRRPWLKPRRWRYFIPWKNRDICYPKQLFSFQFYDSSLGVSVLVSSGSFRQHYYVPFHYKICCVFQHSGSGSLDVGAPLHTGGARRTAKISIRIHVDNPNPKKKHCSNNLYGYWDNFTALTTFNKQSVRHSFTVGTGLSYGWHKMAAGKLWLSSLCHPGDPANPPGHHLTTHQEECAETLYWRLNTHCPATSHCSKCSR